TTSRVTPTIGDRASTVAGKRVKLSRSLFLEEKPYDDATSGSTVAKSSGRRIRKSAQETIRETRTTIQTSVPVMPRMLPKSAASILRVKVRCVEMIATPRAKLDVVTTPIAASAPTQRRWLIQ